MRRLMPMLAVALVLLVPAGVIGASMEWCDEDCSGDGSDGSCALESCCSCCVHSRIDPPGSVIVEPDPPRRESPPGLSGIAPSSPDPRDILHVPKLSLPSVL
jgi:hypothetical protein